MGAFDITQEEDKQYHFVSADINDYMNEFNQPKQEMPEAVNFDSFPTEEEDPAPLHAEEEARVSAHMAKSSARIAVATIDSVVPEIMRHLSKSETAEPFKADDDMRAELEKSIAEYIKIKGVGNIPPGVMVLVLLAVAYGSKVPLVLQLRKANEQAEKQQSEIERLNREIDFYRNKELANNGETKSSETDSDNRH